jgi:uncharacterized BrkB/YihY/UPF0761 family membrane protein
VWYLCHVLHGQYRARQRQVARQSWISGCVVFHFSCNLFLTTFANNGNLVYMEETTMQFVNDVQTSVLYILVGMGIIVGGLLLSEAIRMIRRETAQHQYSKQVNNYMETLYPPTPENNQIILPRR